MKKPIILLAAAAVCFTNSAFAYMDDCCLPPLYIGADIEVRHMPFQKSFGNNLYRKNYPQGNLYVGLKGNKYFGIEAGYEYGKTPTKSVFLPAGTILFGKPMRVDSRQNVITKFRGLHANLIGFFPVPNCDKLQLLASIGVLHFKVVLQNNITEVAGNPPPAFAQTKLDLMESKYVMRVMTGAQYAFNDSFGVRANLRWENTNKFKNISPVRENSFCTAKARDSIILGLGIFAQY